jgi:hypothetical protein
MKLTVTENVYTTPQRVTREMTVEEFEEIRPPDSGDLIRHLFDQLVTSEERVAYLEDALSQCEICDESLLVSQAESDALYAADPDTAPAAGSVKTIFCAKCAALGDRPPAKTMPLSELPRAERTCENCERPVRRGCNQSGVCYAWTESRCSIKARAEQQIAELERERDTLRHLLQIMTDVTAQDLASKRERAEMAERRSAELERERDSARQVREAACPECAVKDAEIARLRTILERIGGPHDCGCGPICSCNSQAELMIWKEEAQSAANEALIGGARSSD